MVSWDKFPYVHADQHNVIPISSNEICFQMMVEYNIQLMEAILFLIEIQGIILHNFTQSQFIQQMKNLF